MSPGLCPADLCASRSHGRPETGHLSAKGRSTIWPACAMATSLARFSILASRVPCSSVLRVSQFAGLTACHTSLGRDEETFLPRPGPGRRLVGYQRAWTTTSFLWVLPTTRCCQNLSFDLMPPLLPLLTPVSHTALVHIQRPAMWRQCVVLAGRSSLRTTRASILERWFPVPWWRRGCDKKPSDRRIGQR